MKEQSSKIKIVKKIVLLLILLVFITWIICVSFTQIKVISNGRFATIETGKDYLISIYLQNTYLVPARITKVSIENVYNDNDNDSTIELQEWGVWVDNKSTVGAVVATKEELVMMQQENIINHLIKDRDKVIIHYRPAVTRTLETSNDTLFDQKIVFHYSVLGFPKKVEHILN